MGFFYEFITNPWILSFIVAFFVIYIFFFVWPWLFGAPFEPTNDKKIKKMIKLAGIRKGKKKDKAIDLGSGDGRIVIALAKAGAKEAHGFEINPVLVLVSRRKIKKAGLQKKAFIHWKNFWKISFKDYSVVTLFQFPTIMKKLEKKLRLELKKGSRIVSYHWKFPTWKPVKKIDKDIYLYKKK
jgi:ubiquinone/menaquinone biosynthesis C-methylase UbiE